MAAHAHVQVGRGHVDAVPVGLQQDVGEDRQRRARTDDALDLLQAFEELFLAEMKFHTGGAGAKWPA